MVLRMCTTGPTWKHADAHRHASAPTAHTASTHLKSRTSHASGITARSPTSKPSASPLGHVQDAQPERQDLQQRLACHADAIVRRWKKKSREKRRALLVETVPELGEHRWLIPRCCYMPESKVVRAGARRECVHVKSAHNRFRDSIRPGEPLPREYDRALGALELLFVNEVIRRAAHFGTSVPQRPAFAHKWNFQWRPDAGPTAFELHRKVGASVDQKKLFDTDPREWCLIQRQAEPDKQTNYDHAILFALLEYHLTSAGRKEKARVNEVLYQELSALAACHEMLAIRAALEALWRCRRQTPKTVFERSDFSAEETQANLPVISSSLTQDPTRPATSFSKPKSKTRPAEQAGGADELDRAVAGLVVDSGHEQTPTLNVTKRAYDMLSLVFADTAEAAAKGIGWGAFVHAMLDMRFSARNGGGSAVVFENRDAVEGRAAGGRIIFHKPHPVARINPVMLHSMGRRMAKWFGWRRELFVLES
ncbi:hypothetical protein MMC18_005837 [Xylographa bjoerkii]|nr:hypothetical protein [Xylographa bjoerkii]